MPAHSPVKAPFTPLDTAHFRRACARFATGICVAAVRDADGSPRGLTINSFTSVSAVPPIVLICIDHRCSALPAFRSSATLGISVLAEEQREISVRFAGCEGDRFRNTQWRWSDGGVPLLRGALATFDCLVTQTVEAGDHTIFLAEVREVEYAPGEPLVYFGSSYRQLRENAPESSVS